jgi:hypothetical protein
MEEWRKANPDYMKEWYEENREEYNYQGSYFIDDLKITNSSGEFVDLRNLMGELNIYEDLFYYMTGAVFIIDGIDLINKMKIVGGEKIFISFATNGKENIEINGRLTAITDRTKTENHLQGYWIRFCSEEYYKAVSNTISRVYEGQYHQIANKLYDEYIKSKKDFNFDDSIGLTKIVIPNWTLDKCLTKFASKARDDKLGPFLLYETVDKMEFRSLNKLMEQEEYATYFYEPSSITNLTPTDRFTSFSQYDHNSCFDKLSKCAGGIYDRQHKIMDLDTKDIQTIEFKHDANLKHNIKLLEDYINNRDFSSAAELIKDNFIGIATDKEEMLIMVEELIKILSSKEGEGSIIKITSTDNKGKGSYGDM